MDINLLFIMLVSVLFLAAFFQELFPQCACCKIIKPRVFFRLNKDINFFESIHVCKKCCCRYGIYSLKDYRTYERIKNKASLDLLSSDFGSNPLSTKLSKKNRRKNSE